jgi:hypothetical protein
MKFRTQELITGLLVLALDAYVFGWAGAIIFVALWGGAVWSRS